MIMQIFSTHTRTFIEALKLGPILIGWFAFTLFTFLFCFVGR